MPNPQADPSSDPQWRLRDAATLKVAWVWWLILIANMVVFAWGLRQVSGDVLMPISCVWLGAFSCCMIFHIESIKRIQSLREEVERLRNTLEQRTAPHSLEKPSSSDF